MAAVFRDRQTDRQTETGTERRACELIPTMHEWPLSPAVRGADSEDPAGLDDVTKTASGDDPAHDVTVATARPLLSPPPQGHRRRRVVVIVGEVVVADRRAAG